MKQTKRSRSQLLVTRYTVLVLSVGFTAMGILREEHLAVLKKAVRICLECIGIG